MRIALLLLLYSSLASTPMSPQAPVVRGAAVSGHVYCADTQTPCRFASVTLQSAPPAAGSHDSGKAKTNSYAAATDLDGFYQLASVAPGEYYILGRLAGYLSPFDLASSMFQSGSPMAAKAIDSALSRITVDADGATTANLTLSRGAALGGTIRYDDGGLAINLPVHLFRKDANGSWKDYGGSGDSNLGPLGLAPHSDSRGRFYEPALPPGAYLVEITLPEAMLVPTTILDRQELKINITAGDALHVFNGEKYRIKNALPIDLKEGEERLDIDITIPSHALHLLRGVVTAKSNGHTVKQGHVSLLDPDDGTSLRQTELEENGTFVFRYVLSGTYVVTISPAEKGHDDELATDYEAFTTRLLVDGDLTNLAYTLAPARQ